MAGFSHFMRCVGRASLNNGARALASLVPMGDVLYGIATDAWEQYRKDHGEAYLRTDLEGLAQAPATEVRQAAEGDGGRRDDEPP